MTLSNKHTGQAEDTQHGRFLTFALEEMYGIEVKYVTQIIGLQPITKLPEAPQYIKGVINLRGQIIPIIDFRAKFKKEVVACTDRTCIIVIDTGHLSVGLIVDQVNEVLSISDDDIVPPPATDTQIHNRYIQGIGKHDGQITLLLDCNALFANDEMNEISNINRRQNNENV